MRTIEKTLLKFEELNEDQKEKAIAHYRDWNTEDCFWYESTIEDAKDIAKLMGIDIENIYFSGFSSQGDGACFTGTFSHKKSILKNVKEYAPIDKDLHSIAKQIQETYRVSFYQSCGRISHIGRYNHEYSMCIDTERNEEDWKEVFADFARWIYKQLEKEYEYQTGEEAISESLTVNEIEFQIGEDGEIEF